MKIKHWQGYGCVEAKKTSVTTFKDDYDRKFKKIVISVKGNHEWGLENTYMWSAVDWLLKKFIKGITHSSVYNYSFNDYYVKENGLDVEHCDYTFILNVN